MIVKFTMEHQRAQAIIDKLEEKVKIISKTNYLTEIEVSIENSIDALKLYHAGCEYMFDRMKQIIV